MSLKMTNCPKGKKEGGIAKKIHKRGHSDGK